MKAALIIGHAGHELRVLKFIELFKPFVIVLTDGSGSNGISRIESSRKIFDHFECMISPLFGKFTDQEMYRLILTENTEIINNFRDEVHMLLEARDIDFIFGDACEGFNPTHDLCRYIINDIVNKLNAKNHRKIKNYDFLLDDIPSPGKNPQLNINLTFEDKEKRGKLIDDYPEIRSEIELAKRKFGEDVFNIECLREINNYHLITWGSGKPFYEVFGEKRLKEGVYKEIITFEHLYKLANQLSSDTKIQKQGRKMFD